MATIAQRLQAEIDRANAATQKTDATVHDAVGSLIDGYGGGGFKTVTFPGSPEVLYQINTLKTDLVALGFTLPFMVIAKNPVFIANYFLWCNYPAAGSTRVGYYKNEAGTKPPPTSQYNTDVGATSTYGLKGIYGVELTVIEYSGGI